MKNIEFILREKFTAAIGQAFGAENVIDPLIKTADPKLADYQSNVAMPLAKRVGKKPREVADALIKHVQLEDICDAPAVAGPGFINLRIKKDFLRQQLLAAYTGAESPRLGVEKTDAPRTIVIDYSAPNVAKQMHIGHVRSTVLGDVLNRCLSFAGHSVVRQNHIGDFGTQFGMLIAYLRDQGLAAKRDFTIQELDRFYKDASAKFKTDETFATIARKTVVEFQSGEKEAVELWDAMRDATRKHYNHVYALLNVQLTDNDVRGESFYGSRVPALVERLKKALSVNGKLLEEKDIPAAVDQPFAAISGGALCVFLPGYKTKEGTPLPVIVQKSDGGFGYATTDLTAAYFRVQENKTTPQDMRPLATDWHADQVIICVDGRQSQHLQMVFDTMRAAKFDVNPVTQKPAQFDHVSFGSIMGKDGKPYKTRSGESVALQDVLGEAIERARAAAKTKNPDLPQEKLEHVAKAVGIGAVKYADLKQDRLTDYIFDWDRMLALEGNTGPYLQYAYTRTRSIFRKAAINAEQLAASIIGQNQIILDHAAESALALKLLQFGGVLELVNRDLKPHLLTTYLYELAGTYSSFYEACPVLKAETESLKQSRLFLADCVARTLKLGLATLLGIETLEEM